MPVQERRVRGQVLRLGRRQRAGLRDVVQREAVNLCGGQFTSPESRTSRPVWRTVELNVLGELEARE